MPSRQGNHFSIGRSAIVLICGALALSTVLALHFVGPSTSVATESVNTRGVNLPALDGSHRSLESFQGQVLYLDFWASWCAPCKRSLPWMNSLQEKYGAKGLQVVAINLDTERSEAEKFLASLKPNFVVLFDPQGQTPNSYPVQTMPTSFLIDRSGKLVASFKGFCESEASKIEEAVSKQLTAD